MCQLCLSGGDPKAPALPSRRAALGMMGALSLWGASVLAGGVVHAKVPPKPENLLTPDDAIKRLLRGNDRYAAGKTTIRSFALTRDALASGQNPYAAILSCADSRVSPELCFDESTGDLFVARVAGNYLTSDILASLEYGVAVLKTPLIMVLGHTSCGAVKAAVSAYEKQAEFPGHINNIVTELLPAVRAAAQTPHEGTLARAATIQNVRQNVERLRQATPILGKAVQTGQLKVVGGLYHLDTGRVELVAS